MKFKKNKVERTQDLTWKLFWAKDADTPEKIQTIKLIANALQGIWNKEVSNA